MISTNAEQPKRETLNIRIKPEERSLIDRAAKAHRIGARHREFRVHRAKP